MRVYDNVSELVGNTPLVRLNPLNGEELCANIFLKLEYFNPSNSVKDRAALNMIVELEKSKRLQKGAVIIEGTSGNTGIALATICASRGYKLVLVIPDTMSIDKINHIKALGATVVLTPGVFGMKKAFMKAQEIHKELPDSVFLNQINNPANAQAHYFSTGNEIWNDLDGQVDVLIAGAGTSGTITGTAKRLKELNEQIKIVCVEPEGSPVLSGGKRGPHKIQGIGPGFVPEIIQKDLIDSIFTVSDEDALVTARKLAKEQGLFLGISSGAAVRAALEIQKEFYKKNIVVIAPDGGERYLNTELYNPEMHDVFVS